MDHVVPASFSALYDRLRKHVRARPQRRVDVHARHPSNQLWNNGRTIMTTSDRVGERRRVVCSFYCDWEFIVKRMCKKLSIMTTVLCLMSLIIILTQSRKTSPEAVPGYGFPPRLSLGGRCQASPHT